MLLIKILRFVINIQEFNRFKQEEATRWNQIISQISLLEGLDKSLSPEAKALITNLRNQLEENKKTLQTNFTLEKVAVTSNLNLSNPRDSNGDNQPRATSPNSKY